MLKLLTLTTTMALGAFALSCSAPRPAQPAVPTATPPSMADATPRDYPGIHNAVAFHENFISGSAPEGDGGFATLSAMGVRTVISVDGAEPEVALASARGIRYIHLPIGYNGFDEARRLQLARAVRDAMAVGPVYIHCHHGKHRSAGAAAAIATALGWSTADEGVARMKIAGTAPNYVGLYDCAANATVVSVAAINAVPADFAPVWKPSSFVQAMVEMDVAFENLKAIEGAGWNAPPGHPDLVPAAEAGRLADLHRLLIGTDSAAGRPPELGELMRQGSVRVQALENSLLEGNASAAELSAQLRQINASCKDCHVKHRD